MSDTSSRQTKVTRAARRCIERWLAAEARCDVPAAEDALGAVLRHRPAGRQSALSQRVMTAALAEGLVPAAPARGRFVLAAVALAAWLALVAAIGLMVSLVLPDTPWLAAGMARAVGVLAAGARVVHFGWELIGDLRRSVLTMLASPDGAALTIAVMVACALSWVWLGRLLAADASDASIARIETA